jgi:hypothetical protein
MRKNYDFSSGERGKFYKKGAKIRLPIYLDGKVQAEVEEIADKTGKDVSSLVNQFVKNEIKLIKNAK